MRSSIPLRFRGLNPSSSSPPPLSMRKTRRAAMASDPKHRPSSHSSSFPVTNSGSYCRTTASLVSYSSWAIFADSKASSTSLAALHDSLPESPTLYPFAEIYSTTNNFLAAAHSPHLPSSLPFLPPMLHHPSLLLSLPTAPASLALKLHLKHRSVKFLDATKWTRTESLINSTHRDLSRIQTLLMRRVVEKQMEQNTASCLRMTAGKTDHQEITSILKSLARSTSLPPPESISSWPSSASKMTRVSAPSMSLLTIIGTASLDIPAHYL